MAADTGSGADQDRHVMSRTRRRASCNADTMRWSTAGSDGAWPDALDRRLDSPDMMSANGPGPGSPHGDPAQRPGSPDPDASTTPTIDTSAPVKSP